MEDRQSDITVNDSAEKESDHVNFVKLESFVKSNGQGYCHRLTGLFDSSAVADTYGRKQIISRLPIQFTDSTQRLVGCIKDTLQQLSTEGLNVLRFQIGKFYVDRRRMQNHVFKAFDPMIADTWDVNSDEVLACKAQYQGLVVIGCVTRELVPPLQPAVTQEDYTEAIENQLILHFKYVENDTRLENKSLDTEKRNDRQRFAGVIYIALQYG